MGNSLISLYHISIHAPARGATGNRWLTLAEALISIHAPARGATKKYKLIEIEDVNFNPRSREGSDPSNRCFRHGLL